MAFVGLWEHSRHIVPPNVYWMIAIVSLFVACYKAWKDERLAKEALLSQLTSKHLTVSQALANWQELRSEKKRLEDQLESELERLEPLKPILRSGFSPEDEYAFYLPDEVEYEKVCRKIERLKEEIEIITGKLRSAP